jgi:hypothetical protein
MFGLLEDCFAMWLGAWWIMLDPDAPIAEEDE